MDELLTFLLSLLLYQDSSVANKFGLIADSDITKILDECFPSLSPSLLSREGYISLKAFMLRVSGRLQNIKKRAAC